VNTIASNASPMTTQSIIYLSNKPSMSTASIFYAFLWLLISSSVPEANNHTFILRSELHVINDVDVRIDQV
jgi:hypothetical protein